MAEPEKKSWMTHLPGILGGSAALIAALTTVYVNLRNAPRDSEEVHVAAASDTAAKAAATTAGPAVVQPTKATLRLERVRVVHDGSVGSTDWIFEIDAGGNPLFSLPLNSLDDRDGQNLRMIPADHSVTGAVLVSDAASTAVSVKGWKRGLLRGAAGVPDVSGQGWLAKGIDSVAVEAKSAQANRGAFVFYFSAARADGKVK
jgi:hypothetical protein